MSESVYMSMYERERVRELVRGSENSAQAFPVFPLARSAGEP